MNKAAKDPAPGGSLLNLAKRMNDLEGTIDELSASSPSLRTFGKGSLAEAPISRQCSIVEEDASELQRELDLAEDVEPIEVENQHPNDTTTDSEEKAADAEACDTVPAIDVAASGARRSRVRARPLPSPATHAHAQSLLGVSVRGRLPPQWYDW